MNQMDLSGGFSGRAMSPEQQVEYYRRLAEIEGMDAARRVAYAPGDPAEADWQGIDPAYRARATGEDLDTSRRLQGNNQTSNMLTLAMLAGPAMQAYAPGLLAESAVASPVAGGTAAGTELGLLGYGDMAMGLDMAGAGAAGTAGATAAGGLTEAQIAAMSMGSDMAGAGAAGSAAGAVGATGAANPLSALYGGTMPAVAEMGMGDALATGAAAGGGAITGGLPTSLFDFPGAKTLAQLAGAAVGAAAGGDKTTSKDPWEPAQQWLKDNIASGQTLQKHYQEQPFSDPMKQASQNLFTGVDNFNKQMPGLLNFANQMMTQRYSYGGTPPTTTAAAFSAPQMGQFGQIDFNKMNPFYKG